MSTKSELEKTGLLEKLREQKRQVEIAPPFRKGEAASCMFDTMIEILQHFDEQLYRLENSQRERCHYER